MSRIFGKKSEDLAIDFLIDNQFKIIDRNFYASKFGEIDIIAFKNNILHFIEVKSSKRDSFEPIYNINYKKLQKIIKSIKYYLNYKKLNYPYVIDAIIIKNNKIEFIENITF